MKTVRRRNMRRRGFTLIEVMIVIGIILALSGLIGVALFARRDEAKVSLAKTDLNSIRQALDLFRLDFERWPTDEEGLAVLWDKTALDADADETRWKKYLASPMPKDRWGNEWGYRSQSDMFEGSYEIWSFGPNGVEGDEDDIRWPVEEEEGGRGGRFGSPSPAL